MAGPTRLELATSGVTGRHQRQPNAADPGKSGSAVPPLGRSRPFVDACLGMSCKFLQAGHERRRPYTIPEIGRPVRTTRHGACDILVRSRKKKREPPFAAVCWTLSDRAPSPVEFGDFRLSLCATPCCRLLHVVAPEGQEKSNIPERGLHTQRADGGFGEGQEVRDDAARNGGQARLGEVQRQGAGERIAPARS